MLSVKYHTPDTSRYSTQSHYTRLGWSMLALFFKCWGLWEKAASTIFVCLYWPLPLSRLMQQMITSQHSKPLLFFLFFPENRTDITCKLLSLETLCMNCQILFSEEKKIDFSFKSSPENLTKHAEVLTLKTSRKPASENVVCLCCLLNILANFSNLFLHTGKQFGPRSDGS